MPHCPQRVQEHGLWPDEWAVCYCDCTLRSCEAPCEATRRIGSAHCRIRLAKRAIDIVIFRFDRPDIERALEALRLFEADCARQPYEPVRSDLVISPENARSTLSDFVRKARRQLFIYDPKVADEAMVLLLTERVKAGVDIRVIGKVSKSGQALPHEKYPSGRFHVRAIIRDGRDAFVGSQSLRKIELDKRREVGEVHVHEAETRAEA